MHVIHATSGLPKPKAYAELLGALDIDNPNLARFDDADAAGLQRMAESLVAKSDWSWLP